MEISSTLFFFSLSLLLPRAAVSINNTTTTTPFPQVSSCGLFGPKIRFPFRLNSAAAESGGYPGFTLSCKSGQTILNLPFSGDFTVKYIDYVSQSIAIADPAGCLPRRTLNFNLSGSPFHGVDSMRFRYYNCTSPPADDYLYFMTLNCLSDQNFTVISTVPGTYDPPSATCRRMKTVSAPVQFSWEDGSAFLLLMWKDPNCRRCEASRGKCGYSGDSMDITCFNPPQRGIPRSVKYGVIIGIGIPGMVILLGIACCTFNRFKSFDQQNNVVSTEEANVEMNPRPFIIINGLDKPTIESFPKTILGESGRLPKPNEGTCPICLSEYKPKETLRTIPECNHFFHIECVDEWLKLNGTCPLCRNTPYPSSVVTPSLSDSSLTSSSPSTLDEHSRENS